MRREENQLDATEWDNVLVLCRFLRLILIEIYSGDRCLSLQVLLYHMVAIILYSRLLMFMYSWHLVGFLLYEP